MISVCSRDIDAVIHKYRLDIDDYVVSAQLHLLELRDNPSFAPSAGEANYISELINHLAEIVVAKPSEIERLKPYFPLPKDVSAKRTKRFKDEIIRCLDYTGMRSRFLPKYFQSVGIKVCVYCNSQLAVTVDKIRKGVKRSVKARFQVDHYVAKAEYPCFSIALFNFYPTCASCNNSKSKKNIFFKLYDETNLHRLSDFKFKLAAGSRVAYMLTRDPQDLKIEFEQPLPKSGYENYGETFDISGIYDTQLDIAEELVLKAEVYTDSFQRQLLNDYSSVIRNKAELRRLILGNYFEKEKIHFRPLAKFIQDISEQLGLD